MVRITDEFRMKLARQVQDAAACLDCIQSHKSSKESLREALLEAPGHVENLHGIARYFAGERTHELYCPDAAIADVLTPEAQANFLKKFEVTA